MTATTRGSEHESTPIVRALLWKEWREQRAVVLAGLCVSAILPLVIRSSMAAAGLGDDPLLFAQVVTVGAALFVWPVFAALTAASAHAERGADDAGFLLSRPVSLTRVWTTKVAGAGAALLVVIATSFAVAQTVHHWYLGEWLGFPFVPGSFSAFALSPTSLAALVTVATGLVFACTTLCASMTRNQLAATALGVVAALPTVQLGFFLQTAIAAQPARSGGSGPFLLVFLGSVAVGILIAASVLFRAGLDRHAPARRRSLLAAMAIVLVASILGIATATVLATDIDPETAHHVVFADMAPSRSQGLIGVNAGPFKGRSFWLAGPGQRPRQITRRMSGEADVAPGDEWVVYETRRGDWGFRRNVCMMRRVRLDGSDDHLVLDDVPCRAERLFSQDGTRVALRVGRTTLRIVALDGAYPPVDLDHALPESILDTLEPLGWVNNDRHILLAGTKSIRLLDVATGNISEVFRNLPRVGFENVQYSAWSVIPSSSHVLVLARPRPMKLLDLASGDAMEFPRPCAGRKQHVVGAGSTYWFVCQTGDTQERSSRVSVLRPGETQVAALTTLSGSLVGGLHRLNSRSYSTRYLLPSPSGEHLFLALSEPRDPERRDDIVHHLVVSREGHVQEIEGLAYVPVRSRSADGEIIPPDGEFRPWAVVGWLDEETLAVERGRRWWSPPQPRFIELGYIKRWMAAPVVLVRIERQS